jgi:type III pantothenate kinase
MNIAIDIGNSSVKAGVFDNEKLVEVFRYEKINKKQLEAITNQYNIENSIVASVQKEDPDSIEEIKSVLKNVMKLNHNTPLPIENQYTTPETLGLDRIAAAVGGYTLFPDSNVLIFDIGTAITIDFITNNKKYIGGNISPGLNMRFKALNNYTDKLPYLTQNNTFGLLGSNTHEAIVSGVQNGLVFEINQYIKEFKEKHKKIKPILTGGDANFFDNKLNYRIFVEQNLVLIGLNEILKYNIT